jgi:Inositol monophosphatase family
MADPVLLDAIRRVHRRIRDDVVSACERAEVAALAEIAHEEEGDTIYAVDRVAEDTLIDELTRELADQGPVVLVAEGLAGGRTVVPRGARASDARWVVIVDPIDGTRGLMYQKRPAWILTGVAAIPRDGVRQRVQDDAGPGDPGEEPEDPCLDVGQAFSGAETADVARAFKPDPHTPERVEPVHALAPKLTLADIEVAVQTEIPLVKQHLCDEIWAVRGHGTCAERYNRLAGSHTSLRLSPSQATTIAHGFAMISRFFPGTRELSAAIDEEIARKALGPPQRGKAQLFEDQYISSGGQLYELMIGHDRFVADLRPLFERGGGRGDAPALCCHPYDLCTELIARELGVIVTDELGGALSAPLDVESNCAWVGYANAAIRAQVEPILRRSLVDRGLVGD